MAPMQREQQRLPNRDLSLVTGHNEAVCDSYSDGELNNTESDNNNEELRLVKRKRPSSSHDGLIQKKHKYYF
jgi:hypothetical protein